MYAEKEKQQPPAPDHSHHLSQYARKFRVSPLKGLQKYFGREGQIAFAGGTSTDALFLLPLTRFARYCTRPSHFATAGLPHEAYFPFATVGADILAADTYALAPPSTPSTGPSPFSWLLNLFSSSTTRITVPKAAAPADGGLNLATALQYGPATGLSATQAWVRAFTTRAFRPAREDMATLVHTGATDGWGRIARMLCDPDDAILAEEWTYPSALATTAPLGVRIVGVPMDGEGMRADALRAILIGWDEATQGKR